MYGLAGMAFSHFIKSLDSRPAQPNINSWRHRQWSPDALQGAVMHYQPSHNGVSSSGLPCCPFLCRCCPARHHVTRHKAGHTPKSRLLNQRAQSFAVRKFPVLPKGPDTATARGCRTHAGCESNPNACRSKPRAVEGEHVVLDPTFMALIKPQRP